MEFSEFLEKIGSIPGGWGLAARVFVIVFVALVVDLAQRIVTRKLSARTKHTDNPWDDALFDAVRAPASAFIWLMGISFAAEIISHRTQAEAYGYVDEVREIGFILVLTWFLLRFINNVEHNFIQKRVRDQREFDQTAIDAIGKLLRATTVTTAALVAMQTLGISVAGILAFGGVGGIAVGFAAKDMLANFFGGMTVYLDKPFKVGDWIRSPEKQIEGTVEHIGWRSTRIRTFDQRPLYVPNSVFSNIVVENPSRMFARRISETIGVRYEDFDKLERIVNDTQEMLRSHDGIAQDLPLMTYFDSYGDSSLKFAVYAFTKTRVWTEYQQVKQDVLFRIGRIVTAHGAEMAFPTRTLHLVDGASITRGETER